MSSSSAPSSKASKQELLAFGKALIALGNSEMSTLAKFSTIFKEMAQQLKDSKVKLTPGEKQLANVIFGVSSFKFLELPDVPRNQILRELAEVEIIKLSFLSQTMKRIIRSANYSLETLDFYAHERRCKVVSSPSPDDDDEEDNNIEDEDDHYDPYATALLDVNERSNTRVHVIDIQPDDEQVFQVIEGMEMSCGRNSDRFNFTRPLEMDKKCFGELLLRHFLGIFREIDKITLRFVSGNLKELDLWNYTKSIAWLYIVKNDLEEEKISAEDMKFVLEELQLNILEICRPVEDGFRYTNGFKTDRVEIEANSSWVDLDAVINSTSSGIYLTWYEVEIEKSRLNSLLKMWVTGERMENLSFLIMRECYIIGDDDLFAGIEVQSRDVDKEEYIVKRSDGKTALVRLRDYEFLIFLNWDLKPEV